MTSVKETKHEKWKKRMSDEERRESKDKRKNSQEGCRIKSRLLVLLTSGAWEHYSFNVPKKICICIMLVHVFMVTVHMHVVSCTLLLFILAI